jgi:hypothetical protein
MYRQQMIIERIYREMQEYSLIILTAKSTAVMSIMLTKSYHS